MAYSTAKLKTDSDKASTFCLKLAARYGERILAQARFSAPAQTGPGTGSFPWGYVAEAWRWPLARIYRQG
jgi:hypothetical protein